MPDETIQMAMVTAGSRGLDVELFVSEISDQFMVFHAQRSYYEQLLRAGVKIYLYRAPTVLHAKHLSVDDDVAIIGSSNMDIRSLSLHMELMVHGAWPRVRPTDLRKVEDDYRAESRQVTLDEWLQTTPHRESLRQPDADDVGVDVTGTGPERHRRRGPGGPRVVVQVAIVCLVLVSLRPRRSVRRRSGRRRRR